MDLVWKGLAGAVELILSGDAELWRVCLLSLAVSGTATVLAALLGVPLGAMLALRRVPGHAVLRVVVNTGMALPPVVVGLAVMLLLWRSGPMGSLALLFTPMAMVLAQLLVAAPLAAGLTAGALDGLDPDLAPALRADGAGEVRLGWELIRAAQPQVLVAIAAAFGRALAEVGASLMVGGNVLGRTRILTTAIALDASRGEFARALALGMVLLALAFAVNAALAWLPALAPAWGLRRPGFFFRPRLAQPRTAARASAAWSISTPRPAA